MQFTDLSRNQTRGSQKKPQRASKLSDGQRSQVAFLLINAEVLLQHQEIDLARPLIAQALSIDSTHPEALKKLLKCCSNSIERRAIYKQLIQSEPIFKNFTGYAHACYQAGEDDMAKELYFRALLDLSEDPQELFQIYKNLGNIFVREADLEAAEEYYTKALTIDPDSDSLQVNLGTLEIQRFDYEKAKERFQIAVQKNPLNDKAWVGLALIHNEVADLELSTANLFRALDANPGNRTAVHLLGSWSVRYGKISDAISRLQDYLNTVEYDEQMSLLLVQLAFLEKQWTTAELELERVLTWNPDNFEAQTLEAEIKRLKATHVD